jgi:C4-dicarboxylate-specific signal transduction histidine kinase
VNIADTGPGVAKEHRQAIFDPFFTTKGPKEGTGLGLYIALQIMWNQGGNLELVPSDRGAKFCVTIAARKQDSEQSRALETASGAERLS